MSKSYFNNFPTTLYFNNLVVNISLRAAFIDTIKRHSIQFYPFVIRQNERPDSLAYDYYDSPEFDWLIFLANDIIDPYTQWPKGQEELDSYISKKYGSMQEAQSTILFYRKNPDLFYLNVDGTDFSLSPNPNENYSLVVENNDIRITPETYSLIDDQINYYPVYAYDYEIDQNESKRNIMLIDNDMKNIVAKELESLLNG